jgi:hypothetical protein
MTVPKRVLGYLLDLLGTQWEIRFERDRLHIFTEDLEETVLDSEQLTRIQSMGFDFECVRIVDSAVGLWFAPSGGP